MNITTIIPILITASIAVIGWFIIHQLSISRDIKNKRVELKIKYLIEAYRKLENVSYRDNPNMHEFETAMADIQLLGTKRQVELSKKIAIEFAQKKTVLLDDLLNDLRDDLRELLRLERLPHQSLLIIRWKEK